MVGIDADGVLLGLFPAGAPVRVGVGVPVEDAVGVGEDVGVPVREAEGLLEGLAPKDSDAVLVAVDEPVLVAVAVGVGVGEGGFEY